MKNNQLISTFFILIANEKSYFSHYLYGWYRIFIAQSTKPEVIASTGDYFKNKEYSLSWTLGECITETCSSSDNVLTQGFQQSNYTITAVSQLTSEQFLLKAYPTSDFITVFIESIDTS